MKMGAGAVFNMGSGWMRWAVLAGVATWGDGFVFLCPVPFPHLTPPYLSARPEPPEVLDLVSQLHGRLWNHQDS